MSSTTPKKIIAVLGATGAQGGGLVRAILADRSKMFAVRAITRDVNSTKAKALAAAGAEVVAGNMDDEASMVAAFNGAYGAYLVTNYGEHMSPEKEIEQARILSRACKAAHVQHAVWSSLEDTRKWCPLSDNRMPTLRGKYKVPNFDGKGESDRFFTEAGVPTTVLLTSFYWENFTHMGPMKGPDGELAITLPMGVKPLPGIASEDIGKCALGIFKRPEFIGKRVGIAGEQLTCEQIAAAFTKVLGVKVVYRAVTPEAYRKFTFRGAEEMASMFQFFTEFNHDLCAARSVKTTHELNPELLNFEAWLTRNKSKIPVQ